MVNVLVVFCTCESEKEAERLAEGLVESRLAACVNTVSGVRSCYQWQGKIEHSTEVLLLIKTTDEQFAAVRDYICANHNYELPEIIALPVAQGSEPYLKWIATEISQKKV